MTLRLLCRLAALACLCALTACAGKPQRMSEHECMTRVMYFESNRSSEEGMIAVGTVVMNRVGSSQFPNSVCGVVGQKNQFAAGVLSKSMGKGRELASRTATKVMRGARHGEVGRRALFFHTAGYSFPYSNMHYVAIAGGNAFYEKRKDATATQASVSARRTGPSRTPAAAPARVSTAVRNAAPVRTQAPPASRPQPSSSRPQSAAVLAPMTIEDLIRQSAPGG